MVGPICPGLIPGSPRAVVRRFVETGSWSLGGSSDACLASGERVIESVQAGKSAKSFRDGGGDRLRGNGRSQELLTRLQFWLRGFQAVLRVTAETNGAKTFAFDRFLCSKQVGHYSFCTLAFGSAHLPRARCAGTSDEMRGLLRGAGSWTDRDDVPGLVEVL